MQQDALLEQEWPSSKQVAQWLFWHDIPEPQLPHVPPQPSEPQVFPLHEGVQHEPLKQD